MTTDPLRLATSLIGHPPGSVALIEQALTHRSAGPVNNERLEFLGDALLGFVIAEVLLQRFPDASEGDLTRRRATLVNREALAKIARSLSLGDYLRLDSGALRSGGHARDSVLSDALEALIGAIYLDQGFTGAKQMILRVFADALADVANQEARKDPKTRLQEWLQARRRGLPEYEVTAVTGEQHAQRFQVRCRLPDDGRECLGDGSSRRRAEQQSAETMLAQLSDED
ncbi:MAG: ribonuclease III [Lamprobacter sp.]|uniref:ribonuclease III n=1 Tax=Lamprobacter sp. TaxID=3100796 RepID=UPI002B25D322|nr:ribonuclease III [Lamprobacter sp.]MEA3640047.1 ribonuclease III [Lamprobacter sp.]